MSLNFKQKSNIEKKLQTACKFTNANASQQASLTTFGYC